MKETYWIFYICLFLIFIILLLLYFGNEIAKKVPYNYLFLFGFTILISYLMGFICSNISQMALLNITGLFTLWIIIIFM